MTPTLNLTDARTAVREARERAWQEGKFLMVTFGANWYPECRNLCRHLKSDVIERSRILTPDALSWADARHDVGKAG